MTTRRQSTEPEPGRYGNLEIPTDTDLQARFWRLQRVGWVLIAVLVAAAAAGSFSGGPLSWAVASDPANAIRLDYERFMRQDASSQIRLAIGRHAGRSIDLQIGQSFLDAVRIEDVTPQPKVESAGPDGQVVRFRTAGDGSTPVVILLTVEPKRVGVVSGTIGFAGEPPVEFTQFVFP